MTKPYDLRRLLAPTSVAVVGASERIASYGATTMRNLIDGGFPGRLVAVNPTRSEVFGIPCVPTLRDIGEPVDAVVVATPPETVADVLIAAGETGAGGAVVYAANYAETGRSDRQEELIAAAARYALPVIGPNANGLVSVAHRAPLWGDTVTLGTPGGVAFVSQSGNLGVSALAARRGLRLHTVVSVGNQAVVRAADVVAALADLDGVRSIALYLEDDGDGVAWSNALAACCEHGIRVVVLKAGRSVAGAAAGQAHTAALAGDHRVFTSLITEAGGTVVDDLHQLFETAKALAVPPPSRAGGVAVLSCSGGDSVIAADEAEQLGVPLATFSASTTDRLRKLLPEGTHITNPLDHTNQLWDDLPQLQALAAAVTADEGVRQLLYVQDIPTDLPADSAGEWRRTRNGIVAGTASDVPVAVASGMPELMPPDVAEELADAGVVPLLGIPTALAALQAAATPAGDPERLRAIAAACESQGKDDDGWMAEHEGKQLLARYGVPVPQGGTAATPDEAVELAAGMSGAVAVKLSHPDLRHKTELGAVVLDCTTDDEVRKAATDLLAIRPEGSVLVEQMVPSGVEVLVSLSNDGVVPHAVLGLGGQWTELLSDVVIVPLPVDAARIRSAWFQLRGSGLLLGARGRPRVELDALTSLVVAAADAWDREGMSLIELNPVIANGDGAIAVDAVVRRQR